MTVQLIQFFKYCKQHCYDPLLPTQHELQTKTFNASEQRRNKFESIQSHQHHNNNKDVVESVDDEIDKFGNRIVPNTKHMPFTSQQSTASFTKLSLTSALALKSNAHIPGHANTDHANTKQSFTSRIQQNTNTTVRTEPATSVDSTATTNNLSSVVRALQTQLSPSNYTAMKDALTKLSMIRQSITDMQQQKLHGDIIISNIAYIFQFNGMIELGRQVRDCLHHVFHDSANKHWINNNHNNSNHKNTLIKTESIDLTQSDSTIPSTSKSELLLLKKQFISDCKSLLSPYEYTQLKQYVTQLSSEPPTYKQCLQCIYTLFYTRSDRWYLIELYCKICETKHQSEWYHLMQSQPLNKTLGTIHKRAKIV